MRSNTPRSCMLSKDAASTAATQALCCQHGMRQEFTSRAAAATEPTAERHNIIRAATCHCCLSHDGGSVGAEPVPAQRAFCCETTGSAVANRQRRCYQHGTKLTRAVTHCHPLPAVSRRSERFSAKQPSILQNLLRKACLSAANYRREAHFVRAQLCGGCDLDRPRLLVAARPSPCVEAAGRMFKKTTESTTSNPPLEAP